MNQIIGFIGAGQMATALAKGLVAAEKVVGERIVVSDPSRAAAHTFVASVPGASVEPDNAQVAAKADVIFLAVKPQVMGSVLAGLAGKVNDEKLVVSIAAGVTTAVLDEGLSGAGRLVRVMPNTPCLVGYSASGYCLGPRATDEDGQLVGRLLDAVGISFRLEERLLDAVTGLSGSGPAFVYLVIEALADGGVLMGLPRDVASQLAAQTVRGAAEMVLATGEHPALLKDKVTSPGGTTIAGLQVLEHTNARGAVIAAVEAAAKRSTELGATKKK